MGNTGCVFVCPSVCLSLRLTLCVSMSVWMQSGATVCCSVYSHSGSEPQFASSRLLVSKLHQ